MNDFNLEITACATAIREPKKILIPDSYFDCVKSNDLFGRTHQLPGRVISSGIVRRKNTEMSPSPATGSASSAQASIPNDSLPSSLNLNHNFCTDRLRTPYFRKPSRRREESMPNNSKKSSLPMTRNFGQSYSEMMRKYRPDTPQLIDPSASVRRIVRGSGLLKTFGTGLLKADDSCVIEGPLEHNTAEQLMEHDSRFEENHFAESTISPVQPAHKIQSPLFCLPKNVEFSKSALELLTRNEQVVPVVSKNGSPPYMRSEDFLVSVPGLNTEPENNKAVMDANFVKEFRKTLRNNSEREARESSIRIFGEPIASFTNENSSSSGLSPLNSSAFENNNDDDRWKTMVLEEIYEMQIVEYISRHPSVKFPELERSLSAENSFHNLSYSSVSEISEGEDGNHGTLLLPSNVEKSEAESVFGTEISDDSIESSFLSSTLP